MRKANFDDLEKLEPEYDNRSTAESISGVKHLRLNGRNSKRHGNGVQKSGMSSSREIVCPACDRESLLVREPLYEGFKRVGEELRLRPAVIDLRPKAR